MPSHEGFRPRIEIKPVSAETPKKPVKIIDNRINRPGPAGKLRGQEISKDGSWTKMNPEKDDFSNIMELSDENIEPLPATSALSEAGSVEKGRRGTSQELAAQLAKEKEALDTNAEQKATEQLEKSRILANKLIDAKIAAGADTDHLREVVTDALEQTIETMEDSQDTNSALFKEQVNKHAMLLMQLERIKEIEEEKKGQQAA